MRHVAAHFESVSDVDFEHAKKLCYTLGTVVIKPLAEALASEERARPRQRMRDLLLGFGAAGRQSVEQLKQSPNAGVRRTAIYLLREFGGDEALPELESLLDDTEPHVQREAIRAILMIGIDAGYAVLTRALTSGSARSRATITAVLAGLRDERAAALFCYILRHSSHRGRTKEAYRFAVEALGRVGGHDAIAALKGSLGRGDWWLPFATAAHRTAVAAALARINTNEAWQVLEEAASDANRGVRTAAKAQLSGPRRPPRKKSE
jgi:HEAT repeat protein